MLHEYVTNVERRLGSLGLLTSVGDLVYGAVSERPQARVPAIGEYRRVDVALLVCADVSRVCQVLPRR